MLHSHSTDVMQIDHTQGTEIKQLFFWNNCTNTCTCILYIHKILITVLISTNDIIIIVAKSNNQVELETASFLRWSINTCKLTSSVRMGAPAPSAPQPYVVLWVWEGFTLERRNRAYERGDHRSWPLYCRTHPTQNWRAENPSKPTQNAQWLNFQ